MGVNIGAVDGKDFIDMLEQMKSDHEDGTCGCGKKHINEHYGIKREVAVQIAKDIMKDMIQMDKRTDVVAKHFPTLDSDGRMRVFAYAEASEKIKRIED